VAHVESLREPEPESCRAEMRGERRRLEALLVPQADGHGERKVPTAMPDEDLVNALAQYLEFEPVEKQALLERDGILDRCRTLIELLEMKVLVARHGWEGKH
jgi:Lon protease-like protein